MRLAPLSLLLLTATAWAEPTTCTYRTSAWHVAKGRAVDHRRVEKPYADVTDGERDPADRRCTVCEEDQVKVKVQGMPSVTVCRHYEAQVKEALETIGEGGTFKVKTLTGYRPGMTRGPLKDGKRTVMSNHAFGTAIDINAGSNGLYRGCKGPRKTGQDVKGCRKVMGGAWAPEQNPTTTITPDSAAYKAFIAFFKWGGELPGELKDFMHFSLTGE